MNKSIFHVTPRISWYAAQKSGAYAADSLAGEGFIHCSKVDQILRVANTFFAGQNGLAILTIDPSRLVPELHWEPGTDLTTELFPHIYGPINLDAVVLVSDFEPGADGRFHFPVSLSD